MRRGSAWTIAMHAEYLLALGGTGNRLFRGRWLRRDGWRPGSVWPVEAVVTSADILPQRGSVPLSPDCCCRTKDRSTAAAATFLSRSVLVLEPHWRPSIGCRGTVWCRQNPAKSFSAPARTSEATDDRPTLPEPRAPALPNSFMHTPFDAELPNLTW